MAGITSDATGVGSEGGVGVNTMNKIPVRVKGRLRRPIVGSGITDHMLILTRHIGGGTSSS